jgi:prepilin-type N-terminal cleavage/methylation domain-containing protein
MRTSAQSRVESRESKAKARLSEVFGSRPLALDLRRSFGPRPVSGFTIVEMLVVIAIIGILAALTVLAFNNFGKSDATLGASRQLLDDIARARQLAISQRTTVYMVFVPANFWIDNTGAFPNAWYNNLTAAQKTALSNLCDKQLTGYTFVSLCAAGDQPGQGTPHYLAPWQTLPDGTFIAQNKFSPPLNYQIANFTIYGFSYANLFPFPTEDAANTGTVYLPYIAFNYLGQLTTNGDVFIPLAKGSVLCAKNPTTKAFQFSPPDVSENPPGNSADISYNIVHVDHLTGRAVLEYHKMQ